MWKKLDYVSTYATELFNLASMLFLHKLAATFWGTLGFSEYSLSRRIIALVLPVVVFGLDMGLARCVARTRSTGSATNTPSYYLLSGIIIVGVTATLWLLLVNTQQRLFAVIFFGSSTYFYLMPSVSVVIAGMALHQVCCSFLRGLSKVNYANLNQFIVIGIFPLAAVFFAKNIHSSLLLQGVATVMYSVVVATILIRRYVDYSLLTRGIEPFIKELMIYGWQRMMGACALIALFTLPAFVVAHLDGVQQAGYIAFSTSLMTMLGALFAPIGLVMLPKASKMINEGATDNLYHYSIPILVWSVAISAMIVLILEMLIYEIVIRFLGNDFLGAIYTVRIVIIGAVPYVIYITMRSVIEAFKASINAVNILLSLSVFILFSFCIWRLNLGQTYIMLAFVLCLWLLGFLTLINLRKMWQMSKHATVSVAS